MSYSQYVEKMLLLDSALYVSKRVDKIIETSYSKRCKIAKLTMFVSHMFITHVCFTAS